jgi:hypothetical protein
MLRADSQFYALDAQKVLHSQEIKGGSGFSAILLIRDIGLKYRVVASLYQVDSHKLTLSGFVSHILSGPRKMLACDM